MDLGLILAGIGLAFMVGLAGAGSSIGLVIGGTAAIGSMKKKPEGFGSYLVLSGLPATQGLYGFVSYIIWSGALNANISVFEGSLFLAAGFAVGLVCLISAIQQGKVCAAGINAIGSGHNVFGNTMILAAFPEFYAILALVASILMNGSIG
ncbi:MAG: ATPase [Spirochaetes bacterium GWF1_31_7]|nr:MAG: ATPase [Spirochaetes bacterium GWE1_32_154]OHD50107.1 MAG: ATPase [Spirochaetes bacterium GWE2_31_10]OHD52420.1 MAG: ATPase [Spirochaetes bacterium GWF1_31_7]OHD73782.1 MAG: ATPase [Spirochaetes bacterium RIFOXYB1_FULL_32_8]HBD96064.1 ATPase [Spirochaetia bacterium]